MASRARKLLLKNEGFQQKMISDDKRHRVKLKNQKRPKDQSEKDELSSDEDLLLCPSGAFKALLSARLSAAFWSNISDCDETFNYWEPLHNLLYGKGFQTWEYSPEFSLRSYTYILLHLIVANFYSLLFQGNRLLVFYFVRCVLALVSVSAEVYFYRCVSSQFGRRAGLLTLVFQIFGTGMFVSSTAFLPSTYSMYMTMISMGAWFKSNYPLAIFATAVSALLSWPFAALIGVPIAVDLVFIRRKPQTFILWSVVSFAAIMVPMICIEQQYYGKLVIPPLNIVLYNVFSGHGPDLYGVEPASYYIFNGFLNFNFVFFAALFALPIGCIASLLGLNSRPMSSLSFWLAVMPMYLWMIIFFLQPHKEERFLFPIYPLICMCGALAVDWVEKIMKFVLVKIDCQKMARNSTHFVAGFSLVFVLMALSRTLALYRGFHASMDAYIELNNKLDPAEYGRQNVNICIGKEWHRFPSSFFFPSNNWTLSFLESEFRGQLPQYYPPGPNGTAVVPDNMNDLNLEEKSRYVNIEVCDYLIDLDLGVGSALEPRYVKDANTWDIVYSAPYLNSAKSPAMFRAFYIPFLTEERCIYGNYHVLKRRKK